MMRHDGPVLELRPNFDHRLYSQVGFFLQSRTQLSDTSHNLHY